MINEGNYDGLEAVLAMDLTNAYGRFYRSTAVSEIREYLPRLAGMLKSELQNQSIPYWLRVNGSWPKHRAYRGGVQGLRVVTFFFCCSLRRAMRNGISDAGGAVAKPKYQDFMV